MLSGAKPDTTTTTYAATLDDIQLAAKRIEGQAHVTPVSCRAAPTKDILTLQRTRQLYYRSIASPHRSAVDWLDRRLGSGL